MRMFFKTGSTITEFTDKASKFKSGTYPMTYVAGDYIYLASDFPFNHFFLKLGTTVNLISTSMTIEYWSNRSWNAVVNKNDYTSALFASAFVDFTPDRQSAWQISNTNDSGQSITGLETISVYDMYWVRISFPLTLTPAVDIKWLGNKFSDDDDLYAEYALFNSSQLKTVIESGKTDWEEQHVRAADYIIQDLRRKNIIFGPGQILDREYYRLASVSQVAKLIFNQLGDDYTDQSNAAKGEYAERMNLSVHPVDTNSNAILDAKEKENKTGFLSR